MAPDFKQKVALYGGSFDPIHSGHIAVADKVRAEIEGVQVVFLPNYQNPLKPACAASDDQRVRFIEHAIEDTPHIVWCYEIEQKQSCYTIDSLIRAGNLGATKDSLFFVMGADSYLSMPDWHRHEEIRDHCRLVVVNRPEIEIQNRDARDIFLTMPPMDISSTEIRNQLHANRVDAGQFPAPLAKHLQYLIESGQNPYSAR